jgi:hypothetical protein
MNLKWDIKDSPALNNSNEKLSGSVFTDDRLYGKEVFLAATASVFMTPQMFSKPIMSNQLDITPNQAYNGDTLIITCVSDY